MGGAKILLFARARLFSVMPSAQTRINENKTEHERFPLTIRIHFFTARVPEHWLAQVAQKGCGVSLLGIIKSHLVMVLGRLLWVALPEDLDQMAPRGLCQPQLFCDYVADKHDKRTVTSFCHIYIFLLWEKWANLEFAHSHVNKFVKHLYMEGTFMGPGLLNNVLTIPENINN